MRYYTGRTHILTCATVEVYFPGQKLGELRDDKNSVDEVRVFLVWPPNFLRFFFEIQCNSLDLNVC